MYCKRHMVYKNGNNWLIYSSEIDLIRFFISILMKRLNVQSKTNYRKQHFLEKKTSKKKKQVLKQATILLCSLSACLIFWNNKCFSVFSEQYTHLENIPPLHKHSLLDIGRHPIKQNNPNVIFCIRARRMCSLRALSSRAWSVIII